MGSDISLSKAVRSNLLSLQNTAEMMNKTQNRLATGNKVNSALDNPSNFFTASALNSRAADMSNLLDSMASGIKVIEAADKGITAITKNIESMQSTLRQARQDKSFQTDNYEVTADSSLKLSGGQFPEGFEVKLQQPTGGAKATLTAAGVYAEPIPDTSKGETVGAQSVVTWDASLSGRSIKVNGVDLGNIGALAGNQTDYQTALKSALDTKFGLDSFTLVASSAGKVSIQATDPSVAAPTVEFGAGVTQATKGVTEFTYHPAGVGAVDVDGQAITTGTTFEDFVAGLQAKAKDGGYTVEADATTKKIRLTAAEFGAAAPTVSGLQNQSTAQTTATLDLATGGSFVIKANGSNGTDRTVTLAAAGSDADAKAAIEAELTAAGWNGYSVDVTAGALTITSTTPGAKAAVNLDPAAVLTAGPVETAGLDGVTNNISTGPGAGAYASTIEAASDKFTITYGNKSADINVVGRKSGDPYGETKQLQAINDQLKAAGITDVVASFEAVEGSLTDKKLTFTATSPEAKALAVSGDNSGDIFGTKTVSTGAPAVSAYKSANTVDQFVEEINRNTATAGKVRASNDNGKLRIENLSTQQLDVEFDKDGAGVGAPTQHKIAGNVIRDNLAKQFNDLRDQLDKFADDSSFNGINLLRGDKLTITFNESGSSSIQIQAKDKNGNERPITAANLDLSSLVGSDLDNDTDIDALLGKLSTALSELRSQASTFGSNLSSVENRQTFTKNMINTLETGAANLTLADTNEEAANLLALQTRQQLSSSALSMASQQDQAVLQLLR